MKATGGIAVLRGRVLRTSATFSMETWETYDIAKVSPAPSQQVDFPAATNGGGTGGFVTVRIGTDGVVNIVNPSMTMLKITQNETWINLAGITYESK